MATGFVAAVLASDATAVATGAVLGALSRYEIGKKATQTIAADPKRWGHLTGWHTAGINVVGSFFLGGIMSASSASASNPINDRRKLLWGVGFCGSFTTFSTFSVDVMTMLGKGQATRAFSYVLANNVGGICAAFAGHMMARRIIKGLATK
uniref:Fluoride ion transporter CrcB n=1 Tax=Attheya septentrionalis TaxID=420275 RepID=A0A7S2UR56_9STRA